MAVARKAKDSHPIFKLAQEKWKSSGLKDDHAAKLRFQPLTGEEVGKLGKNFHQVGSLLIPYFDAAGKPTKFFRVRYLEDLPGFAGQVEKPQRYSQPTDTLNEIYLPPLLSQSWEKVGEDTNVTIYITEGELKAACACAHGLACLALGGVDMWRAAKRLVSFLPQLSEIKWKGREVVIVFDSDSAVKPSVVAAQRRLASELLAHGARVMVASLPATRDGEKQGLDDFLVHHGEDALKLLLTDAPQWPEAEALWALNEQIVYVKDPGIVVERESGRRMEPGAFTAHHYANRHYKETVVKNNTITQKTKPLAPRWLSWEHRFEAEQIVYEPGKPRVFDGTWNAWPGWAVQPQKGDVSLWKWLLDYIFKKDTEARDWFERWCAYPIQHPGEKLFTSCLIWGVAQGTGKTFAAYLLGDIYGKNAIEIDNEALRASFNSWAEHKQFVIGDEITAGDARLDKDKLKSIVTRQKIRINAKYMPEYVVRDCVNYMFTSQHPDALFIEDQDRRNFVHEVVGGAANPEFYERLDQWRKSGAAASALFHHLLSLDLKGFAPRAPALTTASKRNMILAGKSDLGLWVTELKEDPCRKLAPLGENVSKDCDLYTPTQLLRAYDPDGTRKVTAPGLSRELLRAGFRQVNFATPVRTKAGLVRLYAVRNTEAWHKATPGQIAKHYEEMCLEAQKF